MPAASMKFNRRIGAFFQDSGQDWQEGQDFEGREERAVGGGGICHPENPVNLVHPRFARLDQKLLHQIRVFFYCSVPTFNSPHIVIFRFF